MQTCRHAVSYTGEIKPKKERKYLTTLPICCKIIDAECVKF